MKTRKVSFRVPPKLWASFIEQTRSAFISRARLLDHALEIEIPQVTRELGDFRLSSKARRFIAGELKRQDPTVINIEIRETTAQALNAVVKRHGLCRDALFCRLIIFLRASDGLLDYLKVPTDSGESLDQRRLVWPWPASPLKALETILKDPFQHIRDNLEIRQGQGIYTVQFPKRYIWATVRIDDLCVPRTAAHKELTKALAQDFDAEEQAAFAAKKPGPQGAVPGET